MVKSFDYFPFYRQLELNDCGPVCLKMVTEYYGKSYSIEEIKTKCDFKQEKISLITLSRAAEALGFRAFCAKIDYDQFKSIECPCIVHWSTSHFVVVYGSTPDFVWVADPAIGHIGYTNTEFYSGWLGDYGGEAPGAQGVFMALEID
ncbi:hypothetical protein DBR43_00625 [Pedobacter sp. KBW06]|uniref:cysteine peptidase family C39 domain-containing protein n=1 Tax=Pedobacter sp. KBW06 TaxID=2153359 RepID=UPI000F5ADE38|nr:cysteine peptidase family C39 domain-containing protein [Pedobacter sp. KBW06]RQO73946.1 hypothetical protein DBR43_00625 [Pedobacter sp. KBW06]